MSKKTLVLAACLAIVLALSGIALGTQLLIKANNKDFRSDPEFYKSLGNYFVERGETNKAINAYEVGLSFSDDPGMRNNLAVLYYRQGDYEKAISHLRILASHYPDNPSYHYDLAVNLVDKFRNSDEQSLADLKEALAEYELSESLQPGYAHAKDNIEVLRRVLQID